MSTVLKTLEHWSHFKRTVTKCTKVHHARDNPLFFSRSVCLKALFLAVTVVF